MEPPKGFEVFFEHPIYLKYKCHLYNHRVRQNIIRDIFKQINPAGLTVEVGCGIGPILEASQPNVFFMDRSPQAIAYLQKNEFKNAFVSDATDMAVENQSCEVVICCEVLEHIAEDRKAVREFNRILKPGGQMILTVPIHQRYYAFDDEYVSHIQRYKVWSLIKILRKNGFKIREIKKVTGYIDRLLIQVMVWIYARTKMGSEKHRDISFFLRLMFPFYKLANRILSWIVSLEAKLMPLSVTADLLVWCQKD